MDFSNRNVQPQAAAPGAQTTAAGNSGHNKKAKQDKNVVTRVATVVLGLAVLVLIGAALVAVLSGNVKPEKSYVDTTKLQAVFLNTGQVYFGSIKSMNSKYFVLSNIYYLQTAGSGNNSTSNTNSSVTLVKLGCELHEPFDQMIINRDQVTFWENLQDNGQVAKAVATFQKQNPNGQKCADQSSSSGSTTNSTQPANNGSTGTSTTPAVKP